MFVTQVSTELKANKGACHAGIWRSVFWPWKILKVRHKIPGKTRPTWLSWVRKGCLKVRSGVKKGPYHIGLLDFILSNGKLL